MVKGNNSLKNKKLHSSKPYDVSNSFVRKVTSHVTNLLPQPTWISKWFTSNVDDGHKKNVLNSNDSGSEDDDDDDTTTLPPPSKRAKIPLNQQFPPNSFKVAPVVNEEPGQHASTSKSPEQFVNDDAVAGPSGINTRQRRPPLVSSTPNVAPTSSSLLASAERKLNGDDRSESSESTSGCSSLVPQANRQFQTSEIASGNLSARRRSIDEKLNFTGHLQSPRSLFSERSYSRSPRLNSSHSRRNPTFNVSTFGSPVMAKDRIALQNKIVCSPFYGGRTTFGGASAYRKWNNICSSPSEVKRSGVQVKVANYEEDTLSIMSTTARRILEALEQFSSPVVDAKRIPVQPATPPPLGSKRKRPNEVGSSPSLRIGQIPRTPNSAKPLIVPTVPDLLKLKNREKLQDAMESARLIAASSSINSTPICPSTPNRGYRLRHEEDEKSGRHGGKIRSKEKELEEERVEEVNLPNISLPVTSLPKFDFVVPPAPVSTSPVVSTFSTFKFASPITVTENARTCKPVDNFTFSKPLSIGNKGNTLNHNTKKVNCIDTSIPNCSLTPSEMLFKSGSDSKLASTEKGGNKSILRKNNSQNSSEVVFGIKVAEELKTGSVMDILGKMSNSVGNQDSKEIVSSSNNSLDMFKPAPGMWECSSCMIRNKSDVTKCVCCETPRTIVSTPNSKTASNSEMWICKLCQASNALKFKLCSKCSADRSAQSSSQSKELVLSQEKPMTSETDFGNKFKPPSGTWECNTCLVRNPESLTQCQACETKRPGLASKSSAAPAALSSQSTSGSGFGEKFKKPEGSWECPTCMVQNKNDSLKCVACERAKPKSKSASTTKFNFAIPAEASGFKFGVDKAGSNTSKEPAIQPTVTQGFKFGETKVTTASNFTFGVNPSAQNVTKSDTVTTKTSTITIPNFNFASTAFSSPVSSVAMKSSNTTTFSQPGFTFGVSQPSKSQSPTSSETRKPEEVPKKRRASDAGETVVDSKTVKSKQEEGTSSFSKPAGHSSDTANATKSIEEKPEQKEQPTKKVTFSFGSSSLGSTNIQNEKPNIATKAVEGAKPIFSFNAPPAGLNFNSGKSTTFSSPIFGNSAQVTTANPATSSITPVSTTAAKSASSIPFTVGAFGSSSSSLAFGQPPTTTSAATLSFGAGSKTTSASATFNFGSQSKSFGSDSATSSKPQAPTFGSTNISPFGTSSTSTATTTTTTTTTTCAAASSITSPSLPSFGKATSTPSFSLGAKSTIPAFGTSNTITAPATVARTTAPPSFGSIASPNFSSTFSDQNKSTSKSVSAPAAFAFGSSTNSSTSSLGTSAAPFSFGSANDNKGTFNFGAGNSSAALGSTTVPTSGSGFGFSSNNPTPTFNFGSNASTPNPAAPSLFGSLNNNAQTPTAAPLFGASSTGSFGTSNPNSGTIITPTFNFGASATQPGSGVFGFSGSTSTPGQSFGASTPNFNFGQSQTSAQTPGQPTLPTFNPNVKPTFNFTKGETPTFTAAAAAGPSTPGQRRIKKAVRRTLPR